LLFIVSNRFSFGVPKSWRRERKSVYLTNLGLLALVGAAWMTIGVEAFFRVHLPVVMLAGSIGCWLFFIQHQYEEAYWQPHERWDFVQAAFDGSSYYRLPRVLQWFSGNIGFHHIHHLESRIPNYHLPKCYESVPELREAVTLGLWESLRCARLKLWDERQQRMLTFAEAKKASVV
jgi:acyl-lipid omega-6 desaturase (Delta-12 desaturase)